MGDEKDEYEYGAILVEPHLLELPMIDPVDPNRATHGFRSLPNLLELPTIDLVDPNRGLHGLVPSSHDRRTSLEKIERTGTTSRTSTVLRVPQRRLGILYQA